MIPATFVECNAWIIPEGMKSADEHFNNPNSIDIVVAADVSFEVVRHDKKTWPGNYPVLQDTELGWIISDKIPLAAPEYAPRQSYLVCSNLNQQLQRFWETEDMNISINFVRRTLQKEYHKRYTGCFIVRLSRHEGQGHMGQCANRQGDGVISYIDVFRNN
jgi:hypothetical protein